MSLWIGIRMLIILQYLMKRLMTSKMVVALFMLNGHAQMDIQKYDENVRKSVNYHGDEV